MCVSVGPGRGSSFSGKDVLYGEEIGTDAVPAGVGVVELGKI